MQCRRLIQFPVILVVCVSCSRSPSSIPSHAPENRTNLSEATEARLVDFDSVGSVPGSYFIQFKQVTNGASKASAIAPGIAPTSEANANRVSEALAASVGGKAVMVVFNSKGAGFTLEGVTENAIRNVIAKDPRIDLIAPTKALGPLPP